MPSRIARRVDELSPTQFENLGFDLLQATGMINLIWRTPGPDGGRDLEGVYPARDLSGYLLNQKWYIDCKRYKTSLDWPTVWAKIAFSDAVVADFLLIFTNSNPSPQCETEIERWNTNNRYPKVRVWRGYELDRILQQYPAVAAKHGLIERPDKEFAGFLPLVLECMKSAQAEYVSYDLGGDGKAALEAAAAVSELIASRMNDLAVYGRPVYETLGQVPEIGYPWVTIAGDIRGFNDCSLRALLAVLRYVTGSAAISIQAEGKTLELECVNGKLELASAACCFLREIALWADWELDFVDLGTVRLVARGRHQDAR
jgi:hypothetical protein